MNTASQTIVLLAAVIAAPPANVTGTANMPDWFYMPSKTRQEWRAKEEARKKWIKQQKISRAMAQAAARRQRIEMRKYPRNFYPSCNRRRY